MAVWYCYYCNRDRSEQGLNFVQIRSEKYGNSGGVGSQRVTQVGYFSNRPQSLEYTFSRGYAKPPIMPLGGASGAGI